MRKKVPGQGVTGVRRLRILEQENRRLWQLVADLHLEERMVEGRMLSRCWEHPWSPLYSLPGGLREGNHQVNIEATPVDLVFSQSRVVRCYTG